VLLGDGEVRAQHAEEGDVDALLVWLDACRVEVGGVMRTPRPGFNIARFTST